MTLTVAIVGRPNVGKSTLFNRIAGKKLAIVDDVPGVTRDWRMAEGRLSHLALNIIDTAGLEEAFDDSISARMRQKTEQALKQADVVLLVVDARAGLTPIDQHFAGWIRKQKKPVILAANKCESGAAMAGLHEAFALGLGEPIPISAAHGEGMGLLADALEPFQSSVVDLQSSVIPAQAGIHDLNDNSVDAQNFVMDSRLRGNDDESEDPEPKYIKLAIVGRPNVGKSTLVNALIGEDRLLTGPEPGVTRDAIALDWEWKGRKVRLVDTAGLRRQARVDGRLEKLSGAETMRAIRLAHVVVLVLDANAVLDRQDLNIAAHVIQEGRALVVAVNKWNAVDDRKASLQRLSDKLQTSLAQVEGVPTVTLSALKGRNLPVLMDAVLAAYDRWNIRISTGRLNRWLMDMTAAHPPPMAAGRPIRIRYMTQVKARPPTFALFVSKPADLPESYLRYLANGLRDSFNMPGIAIRLLMRGPKNPYVEK